MKAQVEKKRHPLAGKRMTGAEMMIHVLAQEGVDTVFGYTGGAILPTYDAIFRYNAEHESHPSEQIQLIVPANEQGAGFMAAGYARASGKVGAFIVTSGPGATNCLTPIRDCMADSVPVVLICGQVARNAIGTDAFQEAPVFNIMNSCAKHVFLVEDPEDLEITVRTAFEIARSGRPGPVVIDVPKDVQNWQGVFKGEGMLHFRGYENRMEELEQARISKEKCEGFFNLLQQCERPLICAGGGVICGNASEQLRQFSATFKIPVVTTLMGIGSIDTTDSLSMHMLGMHGMAYANYAVMDCDFLITIGARFDDRVAGKVQEFAPKARFIAHIDIDAAEIGKVKSVTWSHVGAAREALIDLTQHGKKTRKDFSKWLAHVADLKTQHVRNYDRESEKIQPHHVIECLYEITQGEAIVCTGVGQQ
jgi:acetolactate synthase I/II/III large subunit